MRTALRGLEGQRFDVAVIGAGVNGASAAQHLAGAGYTVLLIDKGDFASGASSRSSKLLHCGLRYLAPGGPLTDFALHPSRLTVALRMARLAMLARRQFVQTAPERTRALKFHFPLWTDSPYRPWQVKLGMNLLAAMAPGDVPLDNRMLSPAEAKATPLIKGLRDFDKLLAVAAFREYQFEWPERICTDAAMDAERLGAVVRNYTAATELRRSGDGWDIGLGDVLAPGETARVHASLVLNMAGFWIDRVNRSSGAQASRKVLGTKGVHIVVQLPPDCADYGVATINRLDEPFYCIPWRGLHYFGPTETVYEGDPDDIRPEEEEIEGLISEANHLLPSLSLKRSDVFVAWAGVRPLTYDPALPKGKRSREVHDLAKDGLPGVLAMTAGPVMTHRSAGTEMAAEVGRRLRPSRPPQAVDYRARLFPENQNSPPLLDDWTTAKIADLRYAAEHEQPTNLADLLLRRTGAGWTRSMAFDAAERAAATVAPILGWDEERAAREVAAYRDLLRHTYRLDR